MLKIVSVALIAVVIISCSSAGSKKIAIPDPPTSIASVQETVKGKKFKVERAGTHSLISSDKDIQWLDPKTENQFEKEMADESGTLQFDFKNDTSITFVYKNKSYNGTYAVDDAFGEGDKPGIKIRISYVDEELRFGDGPASKVKATYVVEGISDNSLLLQTPRSMNQRTIVVLMNKL